MAGGSHLRLADLVPGGSPADVVGAAFGGGQASGAQWGDECGQQTESKSPDAPRCYATRPLQF